MELLLKAKANIHEPVAYYSEEIDAMRSDGGTLLMLAASASVVNTDVITVLHAYGARAETKDSQGESALSLTRKNGHIHNMRTLLTCYPLEDDQAELIAKEDVPNPCVVKKSLPPRHDKKTSIYCYEV